MKYKKEVAIMVSLAILINIFMFILGFSVGQEHQRLACEAWYEDVHHWICDYCNWRN